MTTPQPALGRARQDAIYRPGALGIAPTVPTDVGELERRARAALSRKAWAYIAGGAGGGATMRANRAAFDRWQVVPRMLHATTTRDLTTTVLDTELAAPLLLAPVGAAGLVTDDADLLIAQGAHASGVPYVFSCQGCSPMEETAQAMAGTPVWYQLYSSTDEALVDSMIGRAEAAGAQALVVTLDTTMLGWAPPTSTWGPSPSPGGRASPSTRPTPASCSWSASGSPPVRAPRSRSGSTRASRCRRPVRRREESAPCSR